MVTTAATEYDVTVDPFSPALLDQETLLIQAVCGLRLSEIVEVVTLKE